MLMNTGVKKLSQTDVKTRQDSPIGQVPSKSRMQQMNIYYPFNPQPSPYPYGYPYPYPSPSYLNYVNSSYIPPFNYYPEQPYPSVSTTDIRTIDNQVKKEAIELEHPFIVKEEHSYEENINIHIDKNVNSELKEKKKMEKDKKLLQDDYSDKNTAKSGNLQKIFKKLLDSFVSANLNLQQSRKEFQQDLELENQLKENETFCQSLFNTLSNKFQLFKKAKEELVKYIIRRTYHNFTNGRGSIFKPQYQRLELFHERNLSLHKSMNNEFLKKQFSNKLFIVIYKDFLDQMDEQFEKQNQERIIRFSITLASSWVQQSLTSIQYEKKLPWVNSYKIKVKKVAMELLQTYDSSAKDKDQPCKIE